MDLIRIARKPYLAFFMAIVMLFMSCEQYDVPEEIQKTENKFDDTFFEQNKNNPVFDEIDTEIKKNLSKLQKQNALQRNEAIFNIVNAKTGNTINFNPILELLELSGEQILNESLQRNLITKNEFNLTTSFLSTFREKGIDLAISNYKEAVLKMSLNKKQFAKKNMFVNTLKFIAYKNPSLLEKTNNSEFLSKAQGFWGCLFASVALVGATIGFVGCTTVILCGLSLFGFGYSFNNWMNKCVGKHSIL